MDGKYEAEKINEEVMMPGFRFHPTDEELVGFYLKRKIQQKRMPIELIKQVDIYKYDPWDLPKLGSMGEKEWYFYCPRDRKYRNSARPNRVTGSGFWKATGTDRPIYSSDGTKCIGLKKSLVFYRGRAAKGMKTDWMMHEFRLPSTSESQATPKKFLDKSLPPNDAWAICRIFKKSSSSAQRALAHAWLAPLSQTPAHFFSPLGVNYEPFNSHSLSSSPETGSSIQHSDNDSFQQSPDTMFDSPKTLDTTDYKPSLLGELPADFMFSMQDLSSPTSNCILDVPSESIFESSQQQFSDFSTDYSPGFQEGLTMQNQGFVGLTKQQSDYAAGNYNYPWELDVQMMGSPFSLQSTMDDTWKPHLPVGFY